MDFDTAFSMDSVRKGLSLCTIGASGSGSLGSVLLPEADWRMLKRVPISLLLDRLCPHGPARDECN